MSIICKLQEDDTITRGVAGIVPLIVPESLRVGHAELLWSLLALAYQTGRADATNEIAGRLK